MAKILRGFSVLRDGEPNLIIKNPCTVSVLESRISEVRPGGLQRFCVKHVGDLCL